MNTNAINPGAENNNNQQYSKQWAIAKKPQMDSDTINRSTPPYEGGSTINYNDATIKSSQLNRVSPFSEIQYQNFFTNNDEQSKKKKEKVILIQITEKLPFLYSLQKDDLINNNNNSNEQPMEGDYKSTPKIRGKRSVQKKEKRCFNINCTSSVGGKLKEVMNQRVPGGLIFCEECAKSFRQGNYCYYCLQVYFEGRDVDNLRWILCDLCQQWVHQECEEQNRDSEIKQKLEEAYICPAHNNNEKACHQKNIKFNNKFQRKLPFDEFESPATVDTPNIKRKDSQGFDNIGILEEKLFNKKKIQNLKNQNRKPSYGEVDEEEIQYSWCQQRVVSDFVELPYKPAKISITAKKTRVNSNIIFTYAKFSELIQPYGIKMELDDDVITNDLNQLEQLHQQEEKQADQDASTGSHGNHIINNDLI